MKKIISTLFLLTLMASPFGVYAQTVATPTTAPTLSEAQLKAKLLSIKKKQNKTKANLNINKVQAKSTIKKVKKERTLKKAKARKAKTRKSTTKTTTPPTLKTQ